jgi:hypothetical protein
MRLARQRPAPARASHAPHPSSRAHASRRATLVAPLAPLAAALVAPSLAPPAARASKVPALDGAWQTLTGAPADLYFPADAFAGAFRAASTLVDAAAPAGEDALPDGGAQLARARADDLGRRVEYAARWIFPPRERAAGGAGVVVLDRAFNTAALLAATTPDLAVDAIDVVWDAADPNDLQLAMAGGGTARVKVTRRSLTRTGPTSLETSEYSLVTLDGARGQGGRAKVKGSQVFSKWRWRGEEAAGGGPTVIATQVVSGESAGGRIVGVDGRRATSGRLSSPRFPSPQNTSPRSTPLTRTSSGYRASRWRCTRTGWS